MSRRAVAWCRTQRGLCDKAKLVLRELAEHHTEDKGCYPGYERLADLTDMSISSVKRQIAYLQKHGLITKLRLRDPRKRYFLPNRYLLHFNHFVDLKKPKEESIKAAGQTRPDRKQQSVDLGENNGSLANSPNLQNWDWFGPKSTR